MRAVEREQDGRYAPLTNEALILSRLCRCYVLLRKGNLFGFRCKELQLHDGESKFSEESLVIVNGIAKDDEGFDESFVEGAEFLDAKILDVGIR